MYHFDCDDGLYCLRNGSSDQGGTCEVCLADDCPDKGSPNVPSCKRGEYGCPDVYLRKTDQCRTTDIWAKRLRWGIAVVE